MRFQAVVARVLALVLPLAVLAACNSDSGETGVGTSGVTVLLKDAPGDFKAAVVTISKIYLQGSGGEVLLTDEAVTTDLLELQANLLALVENAVVPSGSYGQLRFVIDGAYIEVEGEGGATSIYATSGYAEVPVGGEVAGTLEMPSFDMSGLKVALDGGGIRVDGKAKVLLVDFDVAASFGKAAGNSGQWVMEPVVRASDIELTGGIRLVLEVASGVSFPPVAGLPVSLGDLVLRLESESGAETLLPLGVAGNNATAEFGYLFPGTYTVDLLAPGGIELTTTPTLPFQVEVGSGRVVKQDVRIVKASAGQVQ